jgi:hypothetical protein
MVHGQGGGAAAEAGADNDNWRRKSGIGKAREENWWQGDIGMRMVDGSREHCDWHGVRKNCFLSTYLSKEVLKRANPWLRL